MSLDDKLPGHIAIIMDGNGRWATSKGLPRGVGHKSGVKTLRNIVQHCVRRDIAILTVFAFSSENWRRPTQEVDLLLELFLTSLRNEVDDLDKNNIRLLFIGNRDGFPDKLTQLMQDTESRTARNSRLTLVIAANYGGRWDITHACREIASAVSAGKLPVNEVDESLIAAHLSLAGMQDPDLLIRTGGEQRISNYLLWHCAYAELYFCDELWPDFSEESLDKAISWYQGRNRRFGRTNEQLVK